MPLQYSFTVMDALLLVNAEGCLDSFALLVEYAEAFIAEASRHGCVDILLRERDLVVNLSSFDAVTLANSLTKTLGYAPRRRVAVIYGPGNEPVSRAFETAFLNRGFKYRIFLDEETAIQWLRS